MTDFVITETKTGVRAHRATCQRQGDSTPIARTDPQIVAEALPASCCKPNKSEVAALALAASEVAVRRETVAQKIEDEDEARYTAAELPADILDPIVPDPTEEDLATIVFFSEAKVAKHYWAAFGRGGAEMIGEAFGVETAIDNSEQHVTFTGDYAADAREALLDLWVQGFAEFKIWRKVDESYKALPVLHEATSERSKTERVWLRSFTAARAESFGVL